MRAGQPDVDRTQGGRFPVSGDPTGQSFAGGQPHPAVQPFAAGSQYPGNAQYPDGAQYSAGPQRPVTAQHQGATLPPGTMQHPGLVQHLSSVQHPSSVQYSAGLKYPGGAQCPGAPQQPNNGRYPIPARAWQGPVRPLSGQPVRAMPKVSKVDLSARFPQINSSFVQDSVVLREFKTFSNYVVLFLVWFADFMALGTALTSEDSTANTLWVLFGLFGICLISLSMLLRRIFPAFSLVVSGVCAIFLPVSPAGALVSLTWVVGKRPRREWLWGSLLAALAVFVFLRLDHLRPAGLALFDSVDQETGQQSLASATFYVVAGILFAGITALVAAVRRSRLREHVAQESASHQAELSEELFSKLSLSEERNVIAREIHDSVAHQLSRLAMQTTWLEMNTQDQAIADGLKDIRATTQHTIDEMRGLISSLRDSDSEGYVGSVGNSLESVRELIEHAREAGALISADLTITDPSTLGKVISRATYRITQECITNAMKYSENTPIFVRLRAEPHTGVVIEVINIASAENQASAEQLGTGAGLMGMRERAESVGGTFSAEQIDNFWRVSVYLPWPEETVEE